MTTFVCYGKGDARTLDLYDFAKVYAYAYDKTSTSYSIDYRSGGLDKTTMIEGYDFHYNDSPPYYGFPDHGTTTSATNYVSGKLFAAISNISISTEQAGRYIQMGGGEAVNRDVFKGNDTITGSIYDDYLDGWGGADKISGGKGNDTFVVDNVGDRIYEKVGEGTADHVLASVTYSLAGQDIEKLTLTGTQAINGTGNALKNVITGNAANNVLDGGTGIDTLVGGAGDDTYVTDGGDTITETATGGTDLVKSSVGYTLGTYLENLTLTGSAAIDGTGSSKANTITGNAAANVLDGKAGLDILKGGSGSDTFVFSTALNASTNVDHVVDFAAAPDTIQLSKAIFKALTADAGTHVVTASEFKDVTKAGTVLDADDHILYDRSSGTLSYDADGSGSAKAVQFAILDNKAALTFQDFHVV